MTALFVVCSSWLPAPAAGAATSPTDPISVVPPGDSCSICATSYDLDELPGSPAPDVNATYGDILDGQGAPTSVTVTDGYALGEVMQAFTAAQTSYNFVQVASTGSVLLSKEEATSTTGLPPVVWGDSQGRLHFLAPATDGAPGQTFVVPENDYLLIFLHTVGSIFDVSISVPKHATVGRPVHLTCTGVTGQGLAGGCPATTQSGLQLNYAWSPGDDQGGGRDPSISHTYFSPGTYDVSLQVYGNDGEDGYATDGSLGISQVFPITVGKAPKGPNRNGGGKSKKKTAPASGAAVKGSQTTSPTHGTGTAGAGTTPPGTTTAATTPPAPDTTTGHPERLRERHHTSRPAPPANGPVLTGIAIDGALATTAAQVPAGRAGVTDPARTGRLRLGWGWGEWVWLAAAALATLAAGATSEWAVPLRIARSVRRGGQSG